MNDTILQHNKELNELVNTLRKYTNKYLDSNNTDMLLLCKDILGVEIKVNNKFIESFVSDGKSINIES